MKRYLFIFAGSIFLLLGVVGIIVPLLPTTPFLILAAFCFNKGSPKFHSWLLSQKILGPPIVNWQKHRVIQRKYKILATAMMGSTSIFIFMKDSVPTLGKITYCVLLILLLGFIWSQKSDKV